MRVPSALWVGLLLALPAPLLGQGVGTSNDSAPGTVLERQFAGPSDSVVVALRRTVVYLVEVRGVGTPVFVDPHRRGESAFVLPAAPDADTLVHRFLVYPYRTGMHVLRLPDLPADARSVVRLSGDVVETRKSSIRDRRFWSFGVQAAAGAHTPYRLDHDVKGAGGTDWEVCLLVVAADRFGVGIGYAEQAFPDPIFSVHWFFADVRARIASGNLFAERQTDLSAALRYAESDGVGIHSLNPALLSLGLYLTQHLSEGSRGWQAFVSLQQGLSVNSSVNWQSPSRFTAGMLWLW